MVLSSLLLICRTHCCVLRQEGEVLYSFNNTPPLVFPEGKG